MIHLTDRFNFDPTHSLSNEELSEYLGLEIVDQEEPNNLSIKRRTDNLYAVIGEDVRPYKATIVINPQKLEQCYTLMERCIALDSREFPFIESDMRTQFYVAEGENCQIDLLIPKGAWTPEDCKSHYQRYAPNREDEGNELWTQISKRKADLVYQYVRGCKQENPAADHSLAIR